MPFFPIDEQALVHLSRRDKRLAAVVARLAPPQREVMPDLFAALVHSIVGQQVATAVHGILWRRVEQRLGAVTPADILALPVGELRALGLSHRKEAYIRGAAQAFAHGELKADTLRHMPDDQVCRTLCSLRGVGVWTAEMLMLFSLQRQDILSYDDAGIRRGLRMLYRHRTLDRSRFQRYRRRFSPYGSVASLYLWAVAGGALPDLSDPAASR